MTDDVAALLALHEQDRRAHLNGDASLLVSGMADVILEAGRGRLARATRSELRERFQAYFGSVSYSRWDDVDRPHIVVADGGRSAWMAVHVTASVSGDGESRTFESAWIAVYEKLDGRWLMTAIASSVN